MLNSYKSPFQKPHFLDGHLVKCLADATDDSPNIQYAYQIDPEKQKLQPQNLKLDNIIAIFIQFGTMKRNYHRFHEILFIDNTIKHKTPQVNYDEQGKPVSSETNLILLSGINNEGKNVLFGFAVVKEANYKTYKWVMKQFIDFSLHPKVGKVYPTMILGVGEVVPLSKPPFKYQLGEFPHETLRPPFPSQVIEIFEQATLQTQQQQPCIKYFDPTGRDSIKPGAQKLAICSVPRVYPATTIIMPYDEQLQVAVDKVFIEHSTSLVCQSSLLKAMRDRFETSQEDFKIRNSRNECAETNQRAKKLVMTNRELYSYIKDVVFTEDTSQFQSIQEVIFQVANETLQGPGGEATVELAELNKFLRKIFSIKERWATAYRPKHFTCDLHSLARSDAVCNLIKSRLYQRANLIELIKLVEDIDKKIDQRCLQTAEDANCIDIARVVMQSRHLFMMARDTSISQTL